MKTKRHAKPTTDAMIQRIYRRQLILERNVIATSNQISDIYLQYRRVNENVLGLDRRLQNLKPIVEHCERLLREKETLRKLVGSYKALQDANTFMSTPIRTQ